MWFKKKDIKPSYLYNPVNLDYPPEWLVDSTKIDLGEQVWNGASGSVVEFSDRYDWQGTSGTPINFDPYEHPVLYRNKLELVPGGDVIVCEHCGTRYLFDKNKMQSTIIKLECITCGASL